MGNEYDAQAETFLAKHGLLFKSRLAARQYAPPWNDDTSAPHGWQYRVTITGEGRKLAFDFWASIADREAGNRAVRAYDALACISSDVYCPEDFAEFCREYGYDEDSRSALATFKRCAKFAKQLRDFFTPEELEALQEIQ